MNSWAKVCYMVSTAVIQFNHHRSRQLADYLLCSVHTSSKHYTPVFKTFAHAVAERPICGGNDPVQCIGTAHMKLILSYTSYK